MVTLDTQLIKIMEARHHFAQVARLIGSERLMTSLRAPFLFLPLRPCPCRDLERVDLLEQPLLFQIILYLPVAF